MTRGTTAYRPEAPHNELAERECAINNCMRKDWLERHDAALIAQEREKWERERALLLASALNKQDLLSRLISIDQNSPDIRTVEQELQRTIEDIKSGAFDECNPEQCRHVIKMMKAGVSVCEKEVAQAREDVLPIVRNVINTDVSGLAAGLNKVRTIAEGYRWIPDKEWGSYDYTQQTTETLQKEVGWMIDEILTVSDAALKESGNRVSEHIKNVEESLRSQPEKKRQDGECK